MLSNIKCSYFSAYNEYNTLSGRPNTTSQKFMWMYLKVFKLSHLFTFVLSLIDVTIFTMDIVQ